MGKTRLGIATAEAAAREFPGGIHFVALASLTDASLVLPAIAQTLGMKDGESGSGHETPLEHLGELLGDQQKRLLVLDNFEQVIGAAMDVAALLDECPHLKVLVTSREVLRLSAEYCYQVMPLLVPDLEHLPPTEFLARVEAVRLFVTRAQAVMPDFELSAANGEPVAAICRKLEGLPLAIELAAALVRLMTPEAMLARLESLLALLTGGMKDTPARHRTMRSAIGWSYDLLGADEQRLFRRMSVFAGGYTLEAIEKISKVEDVKARAGLTEGVAALLDKSLLRQTAHGRLYMLETIREYAVEQLEISKEASEAKRAHAEYYATIAEELGPKVGEPTYLALLEQEHDNMRAALGWGIANDIEVAGRIGVALWQFWLRYGHLSEGWRWLEAILKSGAHLPEHMRVRLMNGAGRLSLRLGEYEAAGSVLAECLALCRRIGDVIEEMQALNVLGLRAIYRNEMEQAQSYFEQNLAGQRQLGDMNGISQALNNLGLALRYQGKYKRAEEAYEECIANSKDVPDNFALAAPLHNLGQMLHHQGNDKRAYELLRRSLELVWQLGDRPNVSVCLMDMAGVWATQKQPEKAAMLFGASEALRENSKAQMYDAQRKAYEWDVKQGAQQLSDEGWQAAWEAGARLTMDEACEIALEEMPSGTTEKAAAPPPDEYGLTEREREILRLLVDGLTYAEIADKTVLSFHTVHAHLRSIYAKMGVKSRSQATRIALDKKAGDARPPGT